jgi:hypothetical protein
MTGCAGAVTGASRLNAALERAAAERQCSMADIVREALRAFTSAVARPKPNLPLFTSSDPRLAERVAEALSGFGER